jgi:O-antigen/teichoic acid export membrane protein
MSVITLPVFSELFGQKNKRRLIEVITRTSRYLAFIIIPAAFGLAAISKTVMALLFGWLYVSGDLLLSILAIFSIFSAFGAIVGSALQSIGETRVFIRITLATMLTNFILSIVLIPILGIIGSTIAQVSTMVIGFVFGFYELRKRMKIKLDTEAIWKSFLASSIMIIPIFLIESYYSGVISQNTMMNIAIEVIVGVLTYSVILVLLRPFNEQDFNFLQKMTPKPFSTLIKFLRRIFIRETK